MRDVDIQPWEELGLGACGSSTSNGTNKGPKWGRRWRIVRQKEVVWLMWVCA